MPLPGLMLRFLWIWTTVFTVGMGMAAWYQWPTTPVRYALLLTSAYLAVASYLRKRQRSFTGKEAGRATVGLCAIALGVQLSLNALVDSMTYYGATLYPPLPLDVRQGFVVLQTPLYAIMIWITIQNADRRYVSRAQRRQSVNTPPWVQR